MTTNIQSRTRTTNTTSQELAGGYDWGLLSIVASLLALGLVMVFSASYTQGINGFGDPFYFAFRQAIWTTLGIAALVVAARIPYTVWERWSVVLMGLAVMALLGVVAFGSTRWGATRTFFGGSVQPSEPAKIVIIMYISTWLASKGERIRDVRVGLVPFSILLGVITVLIVFQPDISTALLIVTTALILFFIAGADLKQLFLIGIGTSLTFLLIVQNSTYAGGRIARYWESVENPLESTEWQVRLGMEALARGRLLGMGVGNGESLVPLAWSDSIFAIIGEEMGLMGSLLIVLLFALFTYRGLRTALRSPDNFGMLLATGITSILILQAILNVAVTVAAVPPTGVTLPFISYGGSSLVTAMGAVGILLSIGRYSSQQTPRKQSGKRKKKQQAAQSTGQPKKKSGRTTYNASSVNASTINRGRNGRSRLSGAGRGRTNRSTTRSRTAASSSGQSRRSATRR